MKTIHLLLTALLLPFSHLDAGLNIYLDLELNGTSVEGEPSTSTFGGEDVSNLIECSAFNHEVFTRFDASSGLPTGKRTHKPITITKVVDKASPLLYQGMFNNSGGEATFKFFRRDSDSGNTVYFQTITLHNVRVVQVRRWQPSNLDPAGAEFPLMEEVSLAYEQITITDVASNDSATDSTTTR